MFTSFHQKVGRDETKEGRPSSDPPPALPPMDLKAYVKEAQSGTQGHSEEGQ